MSWEDAGVAVAGIAFVTIVSGVAVGQGMGVLRARVTGAREADYRRIAEESTIVKKRLSEDVADLRQRMVAVEKILQEVE